MAESKVRVVGSGFTKFTYRGHTIAWLNTIEDKAPTPVGQVMPIQSLDDEHPSEILLPRAVGHGTLTLTFFELWNAEVWQQLPGFGGASTLLDVFKAQVRQENITCQKIIRKPDGAYRATNYHGCVIAHVDESETIRLGDMSVPKNIRIMYTHRTAL